MAQFSLSLVNNRGCTVLTDYDVVHGKTAGLTFDERLNLNVDGSTLDFSMLKYLYEGANKVVNTPAVSITYGSIIQCLHNGHRYDFAVTDISYQFLAENLQLSFASQDYFQFETSKLGIGYTITGDTTDPTYFGAQPIDAWAQKIVHDNNLRWGYVPINQANREWINLSLSNTQKELTFDTSQSPEKYWQTVDAEYTLNQWVSFECSDSSAYGALKQLAADNGLMIVVDYGAHNFWFAPKKNIIFNGYFFNPKNNLQQFSVRGSAQNLVTVLNVSGPKDINNQEITLVPNFPAEVGAWIKTADWDNSIYFPGLYSGHVTNTDALFIRDSAYAPWLENKLIDISFFNDNGLILPSEAHEIQEILYNKLRIINGKIIIERRNLLEAAAQQLARTNQLIINSEAISAGLCSDVNTIYNLLFSDKAACYAVADLEDDKPWIYWPKNWTLYTVEKGEINASTIGSEGVYEGWLYSPEASSTESWTDMLPSGTLQPLRIVYDSGSQQAETACIISNNNAMQYIGERSNWGTDIYGWSLPHIFIDTITSSSSEVNVILDDNIKECCLSFSYGATRIIHLQFNDHKVYAKGWNGNGSWTNVYELTTEFTDINGCMLKRNQNDSHLLTWRAANGSSLYFIQLMLVDFIDDQQPSIQWNDNGTRLDTVLTINDGNLQLTYNSVSSNSFQYVLNGVTNNLQSGGGSIPLLNTSTFQSLTIQHKHITSAGDIVHLKMLRGPLTFYAKEGNYTTNTLPITIGDYGNFVSPLLLSNLKTATVFTNQPLDTTPSIIVPDTLNQLCSIRDNFEQSFSKFVYELYTLWYTNIIADSQDLWTTGSFVLKYQSIGITNNADQDILAVGQPYSMTDSATITDEDIRILSKATQSTPSALSRTSVVAFIYNLVTQITEKWNNCYTIANVLGIYWPTHWDESKWILQYQSYLLPEQLTLFQQLSPLDGVSHGTTTTIKDLTLNTSYLPFTKRSASYIWDGSSASSRTLLQTTSGLLICSCVASLDAVSRSYTFVLYPGDSYDCTINNGLLDTKRLTYHISYLNNRVQVNVINAEGGLNGWATNFLAVSIIDSFTTQRQLQKTWNFVDKQQYEYDNPLKRTDNTELCPILLQPGFDISNIYNTALESHTTRDFLQLYQTTHNLYTERSQPNFSMATSWAQILIAPLPAESVNPNVYGPLLPAANPPVYTIMHIAQQTLIDTSLYYTCLKEHDLIWQDLYARFPGIFRESSYVNETATNSQELYVAAKAQLDNLSHPSYEYTLTGMDIYMYNSDYTPTKLQLGDQIRIDYQDPDQITDTLNAAIREPLYITGISHTLRNDGDYQFTVTTRNATDSMVQRFAQLLSFGR